MGAPHGRISCRWGTWHSARILTMPILLASCSLIFLLAINRRKNLITELLFLFTLRYPYMKCFLSRRSLISRGYFCCRPNQDDAVLLHPNCSSLEKNSQLEM